MCTNVSEGLLAFLWLSLILARLFFFNHFVNRTCSSRNVSFPCSALLAAFLTAVAVLRIYLLDAPVECALVVRLHCNRILNIFYC